MIRLGLRLTLASGREAALRVVVTAAAVALGVGLLLCSLAGVNGLHAQAERGAWLNTSTLSPTVATAGRSSPLWWLLTVDQFKSQEIDRVDVAATGGGAPVPPGMPTSAAQGSTTRHPRSRVCFVPYQETSSPPASPVTRSACSALQRCRHRTR